jgi:uncharacterized protein (TIGR00251 family)
MLEDYKNELSAKSVVTLKIKVHAGARQTGFKSLLSDGTIKIDIAKIPEEGAANETLIEFLAHEFGVAKTNIEIVMGKFSGDKIVKIRRN